MSAAGIMCVSIGGFGFLQFHSWAVAAATQPEEGGQNSDARAIKLNDQGDEAEHAPLVGNSCGPCPTADKTIQSESDAVVSKAELFRHNWHFLACQYVLAAFSFGVLPSVMPYVYKKFAVRCECCCTDAIQVLNETLVLSVDSLRTTWSKRPHATRRPRVLRRWSSIRLLG